MHTAVSGWFERRGLTALALGGCVFSFGCPQLLQDDFDTTPEALAEVGADAGSSIPSTGALRTSGTPAGDQQSGDAVPGTPATPQQVLPPPLSTPVDSDVGPGEVSPLFQPGSCVAPTPHACADQCRECCVDADCASDHLCTAGACVRQCDSPRVACFDTCVNLSLDEDNCGACGVSCGRSRTCQSGACDPSWVSLTASPAALVARERPAQVAMDGKVFIWGGVNAAGVALQSGATYDVASNRWANLPIDANTPSARASAAAVWTGSDVIVWGGGDAANSVEYADGARYNPASNQWYPISSSGAPSARRTPRAFWTGSQVLIWSGSVGAASPAPADRAYTYDPAWNVWSASPVSGGGPASDLLDATAAWSGSLLYVFGGSAAGSDRDSFFEYDPAANLWRTRASGPAPRHAAFGSWDGSAFSVWGGIASGLAASDGQRWTPSTSLAAGGSWSALPASGAGARSARFPETGESSSIAPGKTLLVGGADGLGNYSNDAALYDASTAAWTPIAAWPSGAHHLFGVAVWSGEELVLWGGRPDTGVAPTNQGERFRP